MHSYRLRSLGLGVLVFALVGCAADAAEDEEVGETADELNASDIREALKIVNTKNAQNVCGAVLVAPRVLITAGHCIGGDTFDVHPRGGGKAKKAHVCEVLGRGQNVADHDLAVLKLESAFGFAPANPTSIGGAADGGKKFTGVAFTHGQKPTRQLGIRTAADDGYKNGLETGAWSGGADSGGGLFLVEGGKVTHKLVGIERQPDNVDKDKALDVDRYTRIDARVMKAIGGC